MSALDVQVAGSHYKDKDIQPVEFLMKYGKDWDWCQKNMFKYSSRYPSKNGIEDLRKVVHYEDLRAELRVRQGDFAFEDYFMQFDDGDAWLLRAIASGNTKGAAAYVQQMLRDAA